MNPREMKTTLLAVALAGAVPFIASAQEAPEQPELSAEEQALLAELKAESAPTEFSPSLKLYGFTDFNFSRPFVSSTGSWGGLFDDASSFFIGNLNVYFDGQISPRWSAMVETRLLFLPGGSDAPTANPADPRADQYIDTGVGDYSDLGRQLDWGGIEIERAHVDFRAFDFLSLRAGRFLTPYGYWNVDHGSPIIISTRRPYIIGEQLFPEAQTGLEAFGSVPFGDFSLGYHLTLSNGRGPTEQIEDLDNNKAIGARVQLTSYHVGTLEVGASAYYGDSTDRRQFVTIEDGAPVLGYLDFEKYTEMSVGADVRFRWEGLYFQSELLLNEVEWDDDARAASTNGTTEPDKRRIGVYGILGYELPWLPIMPYVRAEYYDQGVASALPSGATFQVVSAVSGGIYARVLPNVALKVSWDHAIFPASVGDAPKPDAINILDSQIAVAF